MIRISCLAALICAELCCGSPAQAAPPAAGPDPQQAGCVRPAILDGAETVAPELESEHHSGIFHYRYTVANGDQEHDRHSVTAAEIERLAGVMQELRDRLLAAFGKLDTAETGDLVVKVFDPAAGGGWTLYGSNEIVIAAAAVRSECLSRTSAAHQLFHRVQFAYRLDGSGVRPNADYFVEGAAVWAEHFLFPEIHSYTEQANEGLAAPDEDLLQERGAAAVHFWIYLIERELESYGRPRGRTAEWRQTRTVRFVAALLRRFERGYARRSMIDVATLAVRRFQRREARRSRAAGRRLAAGGAPLQNFLQDWHLANALIGAEPAPADERLLYSGRGEHSQAVCAKPEEVWRLEAAPVVEAAVPFGGEFRTDLQTVDFGGADYFLIRPSGEFPRSYKLQVAVEAVADPIFASLLEVRRGGGRRRHQVSYQLDSDVQFEIPVEEGRAEYFLLTVGGQLKRAPQAYLVDVHIVDSLATPVPTPSTTPTPSATPTASPTPTAIPTQTPPPDQRWVVYRVFTPGEIRSSGYIVELEGLSTVSAAELTQEHGYCLTGRSAVEVEEIPQYYDSRGAAVSAFAAELSNSQRHGLGCYYWLAQVFGIDVFVSSELAQAALQR